MFFEWFRRRAPVVAVAASLFAWTGAAPSHAATEAPRALIEDFHATLLDAMRRAKTLGFEGRRQILAPKIEAVFQLPVMARIVVGTHWRKLTPEQRKVLVESFSRMTIATYANRFDDYTGEQFRTLGVDPLRTQTVLVRTSLVRPSDEPVLINYQVREFSTGWRVIDVYLKQSYSELATRRSEYSSILQREGFDALIREIRNKIDQYSRSNG